MKKVLLIGFLFANVCLYSQVNDTIILPTPKMSGGMPLMEALKNRKTNRDFIYKELSRQQLSDLLWAADGVNRPENGKRTAPSAVNVQEIDVYVALKEGLYLYDATNNVLIKILNEDVRAFTGYQDFVKNASVNLVYVADYSKMKDFSDEEKNFYSSADAGFISQNVYLYCASEGLATVVLGYIDREKMKNLMKLKESQKIILSQSIGFPK